MAFLPGTEVEPKLTDPGLQGALKHPGPGKIDSSGTWGESLGNFKGGLSPVPGVAAQIHNSVMFAFAHWCVLLHSSFHTSDALLSYNDASSNEKPCLFICCWLVYIPFQCCHRLGGPLKFTSVGWLACASPFQSFRPRQIGTDPGRRGWILQSSVSWPLWGPLKVKQSASKEKQTTPCKSNLSSLLETQRGFRVADGPLCHPSVGRRTGAAWSLHKAWLWDCSRLPSHLSGCLLIWALPFSGSLTLSSVSSNLQCKKLIWT